MRSRFLAALVATSPAAFAAESAAPAADPRLTAPIFQTLRETAGRTGRRPLPRPKPGNLLANPGLERLDPAGRPAEWQVVGAGKAVNSGVHSGRRAWLLRNPAWPRSDGRLLQEVRGVPGGGTYRAAVFVRAPAGSHTLNLKFEVYGPGNKYLGGFRSEHFTVSAESGWVRIAYTHKLPPAPKLRISVLYRLWDSGPVLLDDAAFEAVPRPPLYLPADSPGRFLARNARLLAWTAPLPERIRAHRPVNAAAAQTWPRGEWTLHLAGGETGILPLFLTAARGGLDSIAIDILAPAAARRAYRTRLSTVEPFQYLGDLYYDVLVPYAPFSLEPGASKMIWLSLTMPPGPARKALHGSLEIRAPGTRPLRIPFAAIPFRFDLPHTPFLPFCVGIPRPGRRVSAAQRRQWLIDIARHRLSIRFLAAPELRFDGDRPIFDFRRFDRELAFAAGLGMGLFQLPFAYVALGHGRKYSQRFGPIDEHRISPQFRRRFVSALRQLARHLEQKNALNLFNHNLFDEPYPRHYPQVRELARLLKHADPHYRPSIYGGGRAAVDGPLAGIIEEPIGAGTDPVARRILRRRGDLVSVYNPLQSFDITRRPELARGLAWWAFRCRIDRMYQWCICPRGMKAYDYGSAWVFLNPPRNAFLSTVRFEMLREGLEDYDYLTLFARAVDRVAAQLKITGVHGRAVADGFAAQVSGFQYLRQSTDPRRYLALRRFLGEAIERLPTPPRVLFQLLPARPGRPVRIRVWAAPGTRTWAPPRPGIRGSGVLDVPVKIPGIVELRAAAGGRTKRFRIPVYAPE